MTNGSAIRILRSCMSFPGGLAESSTSMVNGPHVPLVTGVPEIATLRPVALRSKVRPSQGVPEAPIPFVSKESVVSLQVKGAVPAMASIVSLKDWF